MCYSYNARSEMVDNLIFSLDTPQKYIPYGRTPCFGRASFLLKSVGIWNIMVVGFDVRRGRNNYERKIYNFSGAKDFIASN